ncbi:hypothetical protein [Tahibacter amnicola]|uniref:Long-chain fatty acid transport protein n=1 Tax=Tahibacter amnicola TaxID=2976241 RepID=A0ABY6BCS2_9GAMM|nr:hypothetical protein [Tahibacter amnicola]UXI66920.1 hypothetical protein N4264_19495 [Tahibacter amnicola]
MVRWHEYARQSIQPSYSWAEPEVAVEAPALLDLVGHRSTASAYLAVGNDAAVGVSLQSGLVSGVPSRQSDDRTPHLIPEVRPGLHRYIVAPSYLHGWGTSGHWSVSALFAYQRFANATFSAGEMTNDAALAATPAGEVSYGRGVRLEMSDLLTRRLRWKASYQSRVNMDAFSSYRGVYADPGDFDIPSAASVGFEYSVLPQLRVELSAERVMYSEIRAFTSPGLPRRFLAALGSGNSPRFAWDDLDVYSAGFTWLGGNAGEVGLRYSTRTQPAPTSNLLDQLLGEVSEYSLDLSYALATSNTGELRFMASYAPAQYMLAGPANYAARNRLAGNEIEFEAVWTTRF